ncbi:Ribulose-1,5 bisphosphate carboxylase/oxygenase large subunit N-methyltransferase, chloroplastic [Linum grandiflorum]
MLLLSTSCKYRRQLLTVSRRFSTKFNFSSSPSQTKLNPPDKDCEEFLPWLEKKAGAEISSKLYIGKSSYGRSLFASRHIRNGDCILEVPFNLQIAPDNLPPDVKDALVDEVDHVTKVAMVLLAEWKQGKDSRWAPYISCLPRLEEMHSTIFWTENELDMIRASSVYEETIQQKAHIGNDFLKIRLVLENFPDIFGSVTYEDFMHAYALVKSRAWGTPKGVSLIPFADFMNHDGVSEAIVLNDESKQVSEVYSCLPVFLWFQVEIQMDISDDDLLHETKKQILQKHQLPTTQGPNDTEPSSWNRFAIREVKTATGKGKGIPQSLRAFARVVSCNHPKDLCDLAAEAAQNDGRLARRPFEDSNREIRAHSILLSHLIRLIDQYHASIQCNCQCLDHWSCVSRHPNRMQMALNFLAGELRILESASTWLGNYCTTLSEDSLH